MKEISVNSKVLSISHNDLDGCGSAILLGAVFNDIEYTVCSYYNINETLIKINPKDYDWIFITDISPTLPELLDRLPNSILIDHHQTAKHLHNPKKHRYINLKYSGTYLTKKFIDKMYGKDLLVRYTKMSVIINDYDMWIHKYPISKELNDVYGLYDHELFRKRFKDGIIKFSKRELNHIQSVKDHFDETYENLEILEFDTIDSCFFMADTLVNELSQRLMEEEGYEFVFFNTTKNYKISVRSTMDDFNFGEYFKELGIGGGHPKAAGINADSEEEMNKRITFIEQDLYDKIERVRK